MESSPRSEPLEHQVASFHSDTHEAINQAPTTFLIFEDRPDHLPAKDADERKRHVKQYEKLLNSVKKKQTQAEKKPSLIDTLEYKKDCRHHDLVHTWRSNIIPRWKSLHSTKRVRRLIWEGIPSVVRRDVWWLLTGDALNIDRTLFEQCLEVSRDRLRAYDQSLSKPIATSAESDCNRDTSNCSICSMVLTNLNSTPLQHEFCLGYKQPTEDSVAPDSHTPSATRHTGSHSPPFYQLDRAISLRSIRLDISRTFPTLGLFQPGSPYHEPLHDLLAAYVTYKPEIGYVQGMSFLAAILLLVMNDTFDAFVMFANILERPCHRAFYSLDENEFIVYFRAFDETLSDRLPRLHAHLKKVGLEPNMYLFDWFFTIFSRCLPLESDVRVWDLFFLDGELALFRTALGILRLYENRLLQSTFDQLASFLTGVLPAELSADCLLQQMHLVRLKRKDMLRRISSVRATLGHNLSHPCPTRSPHTNRFLTRCAQLASNSSTQDRSPAADVSKQSNSALILRSESLCLNSVPLGCVDHTVVSLCSPNDSHHSSISDKRQPCYGSDYGRMYQQLSFGRRSVPSESRKHQPLNHSRNSRLSLPLGRSMPTSPRCARLFHPCRSNAKLKPAESAAFDQPSDSSDQRLRACIQRVIERVP